MQNYKNKVELETPSFGGANTALQFSLIPRSQSPRMQNAYMDEDGDISKRPGTVPVTTTALGANIEYITEYRYPNSVAAGSAATLSAVAGTATLPTATYYVRYTYVTDNGETEASTEASQAITLGEKLHIVIPAIPYHANSINVYISSATNAEKKEYNTTTLITEQIVPLVGTIAYPTANTTAFTSELIASSGTSLYSLYNGEFHSATMTNPLAKADIHTIAFTNLALTSIRFITDGGAVKKYDGSVVTLITPAADDAGPAPANYLATLNTLLPIYCWTFKGFLFISIGDDTAWHSKLGQFDYFPTTFTTSYVQNNDYITGDGVAFDDVCLIPMRRGWGITTYSSSVSTLMTGQQFLNTVNGNIAPHAIAEITYPDGTQTIAYLSDNEVHEVFIAIIAGTGKTYATRSLMQGKIDFAGLNLTEAEKTAAVGVFHPNKFLYLLSFKKSGVNYTYAYDVRNKEWYTDWLTFNSLSYLSSGTTLYFAGTSKLLQKFDVDLYTDWNEPTKATGTIVYYKRYTPALSLEFSGFQSFWDAYLLESKVWYIPSTLDLTFIFADLTDVMVSIIANEVFVEGTSRWGYAKYVNVNFTDLANEPNEILFDYSRLSKYMQVLVENPRDEPVKIYREKWKGRPSQK
jgi:hypothetical protein